MLESIYEEALVVELGLRGAQCQRQVEVDVLYKGVTIKGQRIDIVVAQEVIVEIKSLSSLPDVATAQVLSYLKATKLKRALLLNFRLPKDDRRNQTNLSVNSVSSASQNNDLGWQVAETYRIAPGRQSNPLN